jgi:uncharacterized protein YjbI with pentapeptide repeats
MSKPGKVLRNLCKRLGVRLTVKRGKKRVYKSVAVLKMQCANKKKKVKKVVKRKRRFGMAPPPIAFLKALEEKKVQEELYRNIENKLGGGKHEGIGRKISEHYTNILREENIKKMKSNVQQIIQSLEEGRVVSAPGAYLRGANLKEAILRRRNPNRIIIQWTNIEGTILRNVDETILWNLPIEVSNVLYAHLSGADFNGANLEGANLEEIHFHRVNFNGANLKGANMIHCDIMGCSFVGANLQEVNLNSSILQNDSLNYLPIGANLEGVDLKGASIAYASLSRINLRGADLKGANLQGTNIWYSDLRGVNLEGANLNNTDLRGSNLEGANLKGADLRRAKYSDATNFEGATYDQYTKFPRGFNKTNPFHGLIYSESRFGKKKRRKVKKKKKSKK